MKKNFIKGMATLILLTATGAAAFKARQAYVQSSYSEILLEDVEAQSYTVVYKMAEAVIAGILVTTFQSLIQKAFANEDISGADTRIFDTKEPTYQIITDKEGIIRAYHSWQCVGGKKYSYCVDMNSHEIGDLCNSHHPRP